jgi:hypothetical protein
LVLGAGDCDFDRYNALTLLKNGDLSIIGTLSSAGLYAVGGGAVARNRSTAMGERTTAEGYSTAMCDHTTALGHSTAMGDHTTASGAYSTATGSYTTASGNASTAMGWNTTASGRFSTVMGNGTTAQAYGSLVLGINNVVSGDPRSWVVDDPVLVVGNGSSGIPSNALTLLKNGNLTVAGTVESSSGGFKFPDGSVQTSAHPERIGETHTVGPGGGSGTATCPQGMRVVGGGYRLPQVGVAEVWASFPTNEVTWQVTLRNTTGSNLTFTVFAVCMASP